MGIHNRYDGLDEYTVNLIRRKARQLVGRAGWTAQDVPDLEQEIWCSLLKCLKGVDRGKEDMSAFIATVVKHTIVNMLKARNVAKRDWRKESVSLDDFLEDTKGNIFERWHILDQAGIQNDMTDYRSEEELSNLRIDMSLAMKSLPESLRRLAQTLEKHTVLELSRRSGIPRSTIYDAIQKIRKHLEEAGFVDYMKEDD